MTHEEYQKRPFTRVGYLWAYGTEIYTARLAAASQLPSYITFMYVI